MAAVAVRFGLSTQAPAFCALAQFPFGPFLIAGTLGAVLVSGITG